MLKDIILYSQSIQFLKITEKYLKLNGINILKSISEFNELKQLSDKYKNKLFIIKFRENDEKNYKEIIDYLNFNKINWIFISSNRKLNNIANLPLANLYVSEKPSSTEIKIFLKCLLNKINEVFEKFKIDFEDEEIKMEHKNIIVIGASTGGTEAISYILSNLPKNVPPILVVLHMPPAFTDIYARRLNQICKMNIKEAKDGDMLKSGLALIAPGGFQMRVNKGLDNNFFVSCKKEGKFNGHEPSVDILFDSVADVLAPNVVSVILTGMGSDGAKGLLKIRKKGGYTIGQNEKSCIVYGMPKVAYDIGGVCIQASLEDIPSIIESKI